MRHLRLVSLMLVLALATVGCTQSKIAVVDPSRLYQESLSGKAGMDHLKQVEAAMQGQLASAQSILEKNPKDDALRASFQKTFMNYQQLATAEQQKVVTSINDQMQKTLDTYRAQKGLSAIMNAGGVLSIDPKSDVTEEIITIMNKTPLTFEQVQLEELARPSSSMPAMPSSNATRPSNSTAPKK